MTGTLANPVLRFAERQHPGHERVAQRVERQPASIGSGVVEFVPPDPGGPQVVTKPLSKVLHIQPICIQFDENAVIRRRLALQASPSTKSLGDSG
jgi:hypothetical protein